MEALSIDLGLNVVPAIWIVENKVVSRARNGKIVAKQVFRVTNSSTGYRGRQYRTMEAAREAAFRALWQDLTEVC